ncbi:MAG: helix-turn-helix transcriptional regulator [Lachnospiraceae bacterium]|nr:helix-turn-helix transcriptional regulator [Lachnospiraceae bacterium]
MSDNLHSRLENQILTDILVKNICSQLAAHNWSLKDLADRADLPYESVKKLINKKIQRPSFISIWQIANAFGCSVDCLAGRQNPPNAMLQQIAENAAEICRMANDLDRASRGL